MNDQNTPYKKLYRSQKNKMLGGVCGGLSEYFFIDPTWVRLIFVLGMIFGGFSVVLYLIMWLIIPVRPIEDN